MCIANILMDIINWFDIHQGFAMFVVTLAYVLTTLIIILLQRKQLKHMTTPCVIIDIPIPYKNKLFLVLQNISNAPAKNIKIKFKEDFKGIDGKINIRELFDKRKFSLLPPNSEIKVFVDYFPKYYDRKEPMVLTGEIEYQSSKGKKFTEPININLEAYKGLFTIDKKETR